jgi:predicted DsbA family dithiol-disulfide isomerase
MDAITAADERARPFRVDGVPFFIVNGEIMLSGAQPPETFQISSLRRTSSKNSLATVIGVLSRS